MVTAVRIYAYVFHVCLVFVFRRISADVFVLTDTNFTDKIRNYDVALVKFYVPWCGHCMKLAPEFKEASEILKTSAPSVALLEVDCSDNGREVCHRNGIKGYPTLKVFKLGQFDADYVGPRHAEGCSAHEDQYQAWIC